MSGEGVDLVKEWTDKVDSGKQIRHTTAQGTCRSEAFPSRPFHLIIPVLTGGQLRVGEGISEFCLSFWRHDEPHHVGIVLG